MSFVFLGEDPVRKQVEAALVNLLNGETPDSIESEHVDFKEEPGRRDRSGQTTQGAEENEEAARYLFDELVCFANTPRGGAIVLGVANDGELIGTNLSPGWLRDRIFDLSQRQLTITCEQVELRDARLLVLTAPEAISPLKNSRNRYTWRVNDRCVEVDASTWHSGKLHRTGADWSAQTSGYTMADVNAAAMHAARGFLQQAIDRGEENVKDLAAASDEDLLRRLNVVADEYGTLTNAGALLFVTTGHDGIDYLRSDVSGEPSKVRIRSNNALIEQISAVDQAIAMGNRVFTVGDGLVQARVQAIPSRAAREAIVNGVTHRDWLDDAPTTVQHIGDMLTVTSPGGFPSSVRSDNIITHPSAPRYKSLAEAMATLRIAEREGVGVDRMVSYMFAGGHRLPEITEQPGPWVRVFLHGGSPNQAITQLLTDLDPPQSVDLLLILNHLIHDHYIDAHIAAKVTQRAPGEATSVLERSVTTTRAGKPLIVPLAGVPAGQAPAFRLSDVSRELLGEMVGLAPEEREAVIMCWALHRGRVSSSEVADLVDVSTVYAGNLLKDLVEEGLLEPGRETGGRGFFYRPTGHH